jgi:allantoin racemase
MEAVKASKVPASRKAYLHKAAQQCIKAILEDDASVIMLGCGGLMWLGDELQKYLRDKRYDVPVVIPARTAVRVAMSLAELGLRHSKDLAPGRV